jgi:hypothetical protein
MAKAFLRSFVAMRGWESAAERRIETEIWNNEKESELWDEIEESEDLKFEFDSSHMFWGRCEENDRESNLWDWGRERCYID